MIMRALILSCIVSMVFGCAASSVSVSAPTPIGPVIGTITFKDGRWQRVAIPEPDHLQQRSLCESAEPLRAMLETRALTLQRGVCPDESRAVIAEYVDLRSLVDTRGGVRSIVGPIQSSRSIAREMTRQTKAVREEEKDAYEALKESHKAELRRLDTIIHASSQTLGTKIRRFFTSTPCELPLNPQPTTAVFSSADQPPPGPTVGSWIDAGPQKPTSPITTAPDGSFSIPPAPKSVPTNEDRIAQLENAQKADHELLLKIAAKLDVK